MLPSEGQPSPCEGLAPPHEIELAERNGWVSRDRVGIGDLVHGRPFGLFIAKAAPPGTQSKLSQLLAVVAVRRLQT